MRKRFLSLSGATSLHEHRKSAFMAPCWACPEAATSLPTFLSDRDLSCDEEETAVCLFLLSLLLIPGGRVNPSPYALAELLNSPQSETQFVTFHNWWNNSREEKTRGGVIWWTVKAKRKRFFLNNMEQVGCYRAWKESNSIVSSAELLEIENVIRRGKRQLFERRECCETGIWSSVWRHIHHGGRSELACEVNEAKKGRWR